MYLTKEDVLKKWDENASREWREEKDAIEALKKDMATVRSIINDAKARYVKSKTKVKTLAAAKENPFADLEPYRYRFEDIHEAYGCEYISEKEFDRLRAMYEAYEESLSKEAPVYRDTVTEMLEKALTAVSEQYYDRIADFDEKVKKRNIAAEDFAQKNNDEEWRLNHAQVS